MEARLGNHPSADTLKAFGLGKLDDATADSVVEHLEQCLGCRDQVVAQSGDDFLAKLRQARPGSNTPAPAKSLSDVPATRDSVPPSHSLPPPIIDLPPELAAHPEYTIRRELGRGGMGVVYLAENKEMGRLEVLKVVNKDKLDKPGMLERFRQEYRAAAQLLDRNVATAFRVLQEGELLAFAMEYVEGEDLWKVVKDRLAKGQGPLALPNACYYAYQVALGLQHAHKKGLVHRDIKPGNLILSRDDREHLVKILDFGLAKVIREQGEERKLTGAGVMMGTPDYIAPEQTLDAAKADIRADIYSLGCTLYFLLTGGPPFREKSLFDLMNAHQSKEAMALNVVRPEVPEGLAAVVRKAMAKKPEDRYQTPAEMARELLPFIKGGQKVAESPPVPAKGDAEKRDVRVPPLVRKAVSEAKVETFAESRSMHSESRKAMTGGKRRSRASEPALRKKWPLGLGVAVGVLLIGLVALWAGGVFKVKTPEITNSIGMKLVRIESGSFRMGSPDSDKNEAGDKQAFDNELPQHQVTISQAFYLGKYPVTVGEFRKFVEEADYETEAETDGKGGMGYNATEKKYELGKSYIWKKTGWSQRDSHPVVNVTWNDAAAYCKWLSKKEGKDYDLPTEAQWEYAYRAGTTTRWYSGDEPDSLKGIANIADASLKAMLATPLGYERDWDDGYPFTSPVGKFPANPWKLHDMHGNVWQWCKDSPRKYGKDDIKDPEGGNSYRRVLRGCSWNGFAGRSRAAFRNDLEPGFRSQNLGFRVLCAPRTP